MTGRKRRSSFFPQHNDSFTDPNVDEETERKNRMKLQKRQSIGGHGAVVPPATPNVENNAIKQWDLLFSYLLFIPFRNFCKNQQKRNAKVYVLFQIISRCSQAELAEMYASCMKLSAENKISVKNAFQLKLIDYMAEMMKTKKSSEMDNFQSASCALDASTKIYAYRVDSVHSDTLKLAGGVGDTNKENQENKDNNEGDYF